MERRFFTAFFGGEKRLNSLSRMLEEVKVLVLFLLRSEAARERGVTLIEERWSLV